MAIEILNAKRAGVYLNSENVGFITNITIKTGQTINEHMLVGTDMKVFTEGVKAPTFSFGALHIDNGKLAYLSGGYSTLDTATERSIPASYNGIQQQFGIWQSTVGAGPTVNKMQDDSGGTDNFQVAQSFIAPGTSLASGKVALNKVGTPSAGTLNWKIVNDNAGAPGGTTFISGTIAGGSLPPSSTIVWTDLGTPTNTTPLVPGTKYWLVLYFGAINNGTGANYYGWGYDNINSYHPMYYEELKTTEKTTEQAKTVFSLSTNNGGAWTPSGTYLDQAFLLVINNGDSYWNVAVRVLQGDGTTAGWFILENCVFDVEDKSFPGNDALASSYTGRARNGKYALTYP
jgi:hypothetical protein